MKKVVLGLAFAVVATSAFAGALQDPLIEQDIIIQQTAASSIDHGIIPLVFFAMFMGVVIFFP